MYGFLIIRNVLMFVMEYLQGFLLDFFGVFVKVSDMLSRVEEFQYLVKRISNYKDFISQFWLLKYLKFVNWLKGCGWN